MVINRLSTTQKQRNYMCERERERERERDLCLVVKQKLKFKSMKQANKISVPTNTDMKNASI